MKDQPHCCYCGRFISYKDFEKKKASTEYDISYYGNEKWYNFHIECKNKAFGVKNECPSIP